MRATDARMLHFGRSLCMMAHARPAQREGADRGTGGDERGDVNEAGLASGRCAHHFWVCCLRGLGSCSVASLSVSSLPLQGSLLPERLMPGSGIRLIPRRFHMRPVARWLLG